jgi:integrase
MKTKPKQDPVPGLLENLPPLPAVIRYYDDFSDSYAQVANPRNSDQWRIRYDGRNVTLDFEKIDIQIRGVAKSWCANLLGTLAPRTADSYFYAIQRIPLDQVIGILTSTPQQIRSVWKVAHAGDVRYREFQALENLLAFMCTFRIGAWGPEWRDLVSQLPLPKRDKYASVRVGNVFLTVDEETAIIRHIDGACTRILAEPSAVPDEQVEEIAVLVCSYQFGFRPKQIAMLQMRNIRIWHDGVEDRPAVHLTFMMIKQRSPKRVFPMVRRVKREWSPIFIELFQRAQQKGLSGADHAFQCNPDECSKVVADALESLLRQRRTAVELRHTAIQRLVDAGASEEEVALFAGHSDLNTGLIYFQSSPAQAERVNIALGISTTYQRVAKIAHDRIITIQELSELKGDQQIGGVPHGIPISGIGGCSQGQPTCPYNPVTSCYGCSRFMPVADVATHKKVLEDSFVHEEANGWRRPWIQIATPSGVLCPASFSPFPFRL